MSRYLVSGFALVGVLIVIMLLYRLLLRIKRKLSIYIHTKGFAKYTKRIVQALDEVVFIVLGIFFGLASVAFLIGLLYFFYGIIHYVIWGVDILS